MGGLGMGGMGLGWILWIAIVIFAIIAITRSFSNSRNDRYSPMISQDSPMDILRKRYAKGEISNREFHQMQQEIAR